MTSIVRRKVGVQLGGTEWDTYFGVMFSQETGGLANGYLTRNNIDPTVGVRFRF